MSAHRSRIPLLLIVGLFAILGTEIALGQGRIVRTLTQTLADTLYTRKAGTDVNVTVQTASIATTNLLASAPAGQYRVCWNQQITQAATTSSSLITTIGWNNGAAKTSTLASLNGEALQTTADASNAVNSTLGNCISIMSAASQNITYSTTYSSSGATVMQYSLRVSLERVQ